MLAILLDSCPGERRRQWLFARLGRSWLLAAVLPAFGCSRQTQAPSHIPEPTESATLPAEVSTSSPKATLSEAAPIKSAASDQPLPDEPERTPDIEYVPTPQNVVDKMLSVAKLNKRDLLYDLGCGDGRIVVTAAKKYGVKAVGFDIDPERVKESRQNVTKNGVQHLVTIQLKDVFQVDLTPASVVTLYLLPQLNVRLIPQLEKLAAGARIVSHDFDMEGVEPENSWTLLAPDHEPPYADRDHYVYLWRTPLQRTPAK